MTGPQASGDRSVAAHTISGVVFTGDNPHLTTLHVERMPAAQQVRDGAVAHNLPPVSGVFVGRDLGELAQLLGGLGSGAGVVVGQAAVHGLGGIGKTELVAHYAHAYLDRYPLVWWITADTLDNIGLGLAELTRRLHPVATLADAQAWAVGWLQSNPGWLLVLDNVEDIEHIRPLLGTVAGQGQVVVTTRRDLGPARWRALGLAPLRLGVLARDASIDLLTRLTGQDDRDGAARLASELGDLPLALEQAAAYLGQHDGLTFDDYRARLASRFDRLAADPAEGGQSGRTIARVWQVTIDAVTGRSPLAVRVLAVLGWLAPDGLPIDVLTPLGDDPADVDDAVAVLASYNMVHRFGGVVDVHRLVQAVTRRADETTGSGERSACAAAVELLAAAIPGDPVDHVAGWPRWTALLPHIDALLANLPDTHTDTTILHVGDDAATFRLNQGQLTAAIFLFERVLTDRRRVLGDDHSDTLVSCDHLALAYRDAGRVAEAITLFEQLLADCRRVLGDDHPEMLTFRHNLAYGYQAAGRVAEAITLFEQVRTDSQRVLGDDHPITLASRHNLGGAYRAAGRVAEAITLFEHLPDDCQRVLGDDHPSTLASRNYLALAYRDAGRVAEAITLYEQLLADCQRVLGDDHPNTLACRNYLAGAYQDAGRVAEAITLYEQVLTDSQRVLGDDHPNTLACRNNLADAYQAAGRVAEAIILFEQVLTDSQRVLGDDHPGTLKSRHNLAGAYRAAGRVAEAIILFEQVLTDRRQVLGDDHPGTLASGHSLAGAYQAAGRVAEAIILFEQVLTDSQRVLGDDHPQTSAVAENLRGAQAHEKD